MLLSLLALVQHTLQELEPRIPQQALVRYALQELAHMSSACTDATAAAGGGSKVFHHKCWHTIHRKGWFGLCLLRRQERTTSCRYRCVMMASTIWLQWGLPRSRSRCKRRRTLECVHDVQHSVSLRVAESVCFISSGTRCGPPQVRQRDMTRKRRCFALAQWTSLHGCEFVL